MAVEFQEIIYEKNNRIATVTLNKPERLNSMSTQMRDELDMVIEDLENDDDTRVLIIKGAGRAFCSGYFLGGGGQRREPLVYDTGLGDQPRAQRIGASWTRRNIRMSHERWMRLWNVRQVTIAQVHGYCLAGGNDLIAVCDIVFAAEDAMIGQPQARSMGHLHTFGMWPVYMNPRKAKEWLFTGDYMSGKEAERLGLVNRAVPPELLEQEVMEYAQRVAKIPLDFLHAHKDMVNRWLETYGVRAMMQTACDMDVILLNSPHGLEFSRLIREEGIRSALEWRDGPFREGDNPEQAVLRRPEKLANLRKQ